MENIIAFYQQCIKDLLSQYTQLKTPETNITLSFDDERKCYMVMRVGWFERYKRIHRCLIHIEISDTLIVIQANNTEDPIVSDLIALGIPKEKICLGFIPSDFRAYAEQESFSNSESKADSTRRKSSAYQSSSADTLLSMP